MEKYVHNLTRDYIFILGAQDPEMLAIRGILDACASHVSSGWIVAQAAITEGHVTHPVNSGTAYKATHLIDLSTDDVYEPGNIDGLMGYAEWVPEEDRDGIVPVYIESGILYADRSHAIIIDHHRPGDPGYNKPPEQYWAGSSLGQTWKFLRELGFTEQQLMEIFPRNRFLIAASDHCPAAAFAGKCPGIDVNELRKHRRKVVAQYRKIDPDELGKRIDAAKEMILAAPVLTLTHYDLIFSYRDCKALDIPELNHAQLELGIPVEYAMLPTERSPRVKIGLIGATEPKLIELWMKFKKGELRDMYGSPERGYAGGYLD